MFSQDSRENSMQWLILVFFLLFGSEILRTEIIWISCKFLADCYIYIIMDIHILSLLYFHYHGVRSTNWEICWSDQSYIDIASSRNSCILDKNAHKQRMINENKQRNCNLSNWHVATRCSWKNNSQNRLKPFE